MLGLVAIDLARCVDPLGRVIERLKMTKAGYCEEVKRMFLIHTE